MTREPSLECYVDALREDLPSEGTEARLKQRLASAGIGISVALVTKTAAAACAAPAAKVGIVSALSARFAGLPLLWQMGLVTATTAMVATGPLMVMTEVPSGRNLEAVPAEPRARHAQGKRETDPKTMETLARESTRADEVAAEAAPDSPAVPAVQPRNAERQLEIASTERDSPELRSLAEETRLIDRALASIRAGKLQDAARQLDEHDQRFPDGRLKREQRRAREKLEEARRNGEPSFSNQN